LEWTREVVAKSPGTIRYRIESQGPFSVTVISDRLLKAFQSGSKEPPKKEDVLQAVDFEGPMGEGTVMLPAGSFHFVIKNAASQTVRFRLQCFAD
jgi:hypothetical protein